MKINWMFQGNCDCICRDPSSDYFFRHPILFIVRVNIISRHKIRAYPTFENPNFVDNFWGGKKKGILQQAYASLRILTAAQLPSPVFQ